MVDIVDFVHCVVVGGVVGVVGNGYHTLVALGDYTGHHLTVAQVDLHFGRFLLCVGTEGNCCHNQCEK